MKTLTMVQGGRGKPSRDELERREAADEGPRVTLDEKRLNSELLDERDVGRAEGLRGLLYRPLPVGVAMALEAFRRRDRYDAVVSWAEHFGLPFATLLKATGARVPHVGLFSWISSPRKAAWLKRVHSHVHRLVLWSSFQYEFAVNQIGVPPTRIVQLRWLVDQKFWRPLDVPPSDMICAAGREMRDYATLIEAIRDSRVPCYIAANGDAARKDRWMRDLHGLPIPPHVTFGAMPYPELRALYARSRFVVIPLYPTDTDNGVTVMTESMAMGKAVICSRVAGQRDLIRDGVNGIVVPPRDPRALRQAIEHLWDHPEVCERMGREGRKSIEAAHTLDRFVDGVHGAVEAAIREVRGSSPRSASGIVAGGGR